MKNAIQNQLKYWFCWTLCLAILILSCSPSRPNLNAYRLKKETFSSKEKNRQELVLYARQQIGCKYKKAGKGKGGFDCSGYVAFVYHKFNIALKPSAHEQALQKPEISIKDASPGDLIFFGKSNQITHVGMISQNKKEELYIIHSTSSKGVIEENILKSDYWLRRIIKIVDLNSYILPEEISGL